MTVIAPRKYNPGFLSDDDLVASFCVRTAEFESVMEMLRECTGRSNTHQIVIGPRGSGKTSLLLRVAAELRRDAALSSAFFPVAFAEESYEIATAGEFWLECLSRLADQAPRREGDPDLRRSYEDLRAIRDDRTLGDRCLGALLDFSDQENKRLVLAVENLNMMFRDMADPDAGWRLRKVLQTEPRIVLLASATSRFDEIDNPEHALYDQFRTLTLRPLDTKECAVLWEAASGRSAPAGTVRSLEILTGGSPRLLAIVARFGAGRSFRDLMADLLDLIDDHTEYFKSHLESLPAQERRVYLALADLWIPALTREIANRARLDTSKCSAWLARLVERGAVQVEGGSARRKQYYLSERLYNIYYLLRRRGGSDGLVEALIRFMASFYSPHELKDIGAGIAREAQESDTETRTLLRSAFARLMELPALAVSRDELLEIAPSEFAEIPDPGKVKPDHDRAGKPDTSGEEKSEAVAARALFDEAVALHNRERAEEALSAYDELAFRFEASDSSFVHNLIAKALVNRGVLLTQMNKKEEALISLDNAVRRFGESLVPIFPETAASAFVSKGYTLSEMNRPEEAVAAYDEVIHRFGESQRLAVLKVVAKALVDKALGLRALNRPEEAVAACDEVMHRFGESRIPALLEVAMPAFVNKVYALRALNRLEEAVSACDEVVRRFGQSRTPSLLEAVASALGNKGGTLLLLNRPEEALAAYDEVVRRFGDSEVLDLRKEVAKALVNRGPALGALNLREEELAAYDEVAHRFGESQDPPVLETVGTALVNKGIVLDMLNRPEEAWTAYDEATRRFGDHEFPTIRTQIEFAFIGKAELELRCGRHEAAIETMTRALDRNITELPRQWRSHLVRAQAGLAAGDPTVYERDIEAMLAILPKIAPLPTATLYALLEFVIDIGAKRMRELIQASPAASLLLPITTALEWELGLKPRVAREVEEVAGDIRQRLKELREARADGVG